MNKIFKVIIIGGGASGLLCATELLRKDNAFSGEDVLLIERLARVGKKLVATGNGQGNLYNENMREEFYHGDKEFISSVVCGIKQLCLINYFKDLGILTVSEAGGKVYPLSRQASSVLDIIRAELIEKNLNILTETKAQDVEYKKGIFTVFTDKGTFYAENVVLACGGKAAGQYGTDGEGYALSEKFGHRVTPLYPSLVQLKTDTKKIKGLKGIKTTAEVKIKSGEKVIKTVRGDLLFTDYGVSGNTIFNLSGYAAESDNPTLEIDFLPDIDEKELADVLRERKNKSFVKTEGIFCGLVNKMLGKALEKSSPDKAEKSLAKTAKCFTLKVCGNTGFDCAQVTKGGISTKDVCDKTFESTLRNGFYITGEALNVDGDCGGYNLAFAFYSGIIAAKSVKGKYLSCKS